MSLKKMKVTMSCRGRKKATRRLLKVNVLSLRFPRVVFSRTVSFSLSYVGLGLSFFSFAENVGMGASAVKGNDADFGILLIE